MKAIKVFDNKYVGHRDQNIPSKILTNDKNNRQLLKLSYY